MDLIPIGVSAPIPTQRNHNGRIPLDRTVVAASIRFAGLAAGRVAQERFPEVPRCRDEKNSRAIDERKGTHVYLSFGLFPNLPSAIEVYIDCRLCLSRGRNIFHFVARLSMEIEIAG